MTTDRLQARFVSTSTGNRLLIRLDISEDMERESLLLPSDRRYAELAWSIAHRIAQPLAVIRLSVDTLREELNSPHGRADPLSLGATLHEKLARIAHQTERAAAIVRELHAVHMPIDEPSG